MSIIKLILVSLITFTLTASPTAAADPVNFCHDEATWRQWTELVRENPGDDQLQILHALRIGFCIKIEQGSISFDRANRLFNRIHESTIEQRRQEEERGRRNEKG